VRCLILGVEQTDAGLRVALSIQLSLLGTIARPSSHIPEN
jgi:hypothetical protein